MSSRLGMARLMFSIGLIKIIRWID